MKIIGIDPDIKASGVACYDEHGLTLHNMSFFELYYFLKSRSEYTVVIERGEENRHLFNARGNFRTSLNIAMKTGKNFAVSDLLFEMCEVLGVKNVHSYVPGTQKMSHEQLTKIVKMPNKSNQEQRDAVRCILSFIL